MIRLRSTSLSFAGQVQINHGLHRYENCSARRPSGKVSCKTNRTTLSNYINVLFRDTPVVIFKENI